ncbi:MAG: diguanylate cyclase [Treponema sp.]|nr:diguanylate cyclase [Treponema sp.]
MKRRIGTFVVLLAIIVFSFLFFQRRISATVYANSTNFLKETAILYAGTFKVKLNDQLFMLESQARYFADVDMNDYNKIKQTIMSTKGVGEFKRIAVANTSGMTINYDGKSSGNIMMNDYFKKALRGIASVSSNISLDEDGEKVLTLAVPIFQNKKVVGVITGTFAYSILDNIFAVDTFSGSGYSFLVDSTGRVLVGSSSAERLCFSENWLTFMADQQALSNLRLNTIRNDIKANKTDSVRYEINGEERIMVYTPVNMNGWYVLSAVTADYLDAQQRRIVWMSIMLILVVLLVFSAFIYLILKLLKENEKIEKDNVRYAVTSQSSQTLVYEYDFERKVIEFTGDTKFLFGENLHQLPLDWFNMIEERIHESERDLRSHLKKFIDSGESTYGSELRILAGEGEYVWYRLSGTLIKDKEGGAPLKLIGSLANVNEQIVHEQELKEMAETDLLSGLLNKVSMEKHITEWIKNASPNAEGAFYMLDLDNFKQVNDKIGHSAGDTAICDAANKINLVFSERDFIGRIGGDEFCVFLTLPETMEHDKIDEIIAEKAGVLNSILRETYTSGDVAVHVTSSIGISLFPAQAGSYKELFKRADAALYHVKENGKNSFAIFDENTMKEAGESVYG